MAGRKLLWQLYPAYLIITLGSLVFLGWYVSKTLREFYLAQTAEDLRVRAEFLGPQVMGRLAVVDTGGVNLLCRNYGKAGSTRITVILPSGRVIGDSDEDPTKMDNHSDRPEVIEALAGRVGKSIRFSYTQGKDMIYLAVPVRPEGKTLYVLRTAKPLTAIISALNKVYFRVVWASAALIIILGVLGFFLSRRISKPLENLRNGVERFAKGDLQYKLPLFRTKEISDLAEAMKYMAERLDERIKTIVEQRNELEILLSGMIEGVLAVDTDERVIMLNQAAGRLFGVNPAEAQGRNILEVVRNTDLENFIRSALSSREPVEREISIIVQGKERLLQAHGTLLREEQGLRTATLIVFHDITRLRMLENIRRDFVANVSHELKTPITSIKGFVETLLAGAKNDPEEAGRFLRIIAKQADRLSSIIDDLLNLSRIEQEEEKGEIQLEERQIRDILSGAIQSCKASAEAKNINIELLCPENLQALIEARLLELAVVNLIDNAIKYSESGSSVQVEALIKDSEVIINVRDHGCGIEKKYLPRLFERFYRVDKSRSRKLGGTGLGLALVKHIVLVHSGRVSVESTPGKGSTFSIHLPRN